MTEDILETSISACTFRNRWQYFRPYHSLRIELAHEDPARHHFPLQRPQPMSARAAKYRTEMAHPFGRYYCTGFRVQWSAHWGDSKTRHSHRVYTKRQSLLEADLRNIHIGSGLGKSPLRYLWKGETTRHTRNVWHHETKHKIKQR